MQYQESSFTPKKLRQGNFVRFVYNNPHLSLDEVCAIFSNKPRKQVKDQWYRVQREIKVSAQMEQMKHLHRLAIAPPASLIHSCRQPERIYVDCADTGK